MGRWAMITTTDLEVSVQPMNTREDASEAEELDALRTYFDAHALLPGAEDEEEFEGLDVEEVKLWGAVLSEADATTELLLEGLILLAHTPRTEALTVLEGYCASPHAGFELLANLARDECLFWLERTKQPPKRRRRAG